MEKWGKFYWIIVAPHVRFFVWGEGGIGGWLEGDEGWE